MLLSQFGPPAGIFRWTDISGMASHADFWYSIRQQLTTSLENQPGLITKEPSFLKRKQYIVDYLDFKVSQLCY
jgi:hypothetical protein